MDRRCIAIKPELYAAIIIEGTRRGISNFSAIIGQLVEERLLELNKQKGLFEEDDD